MSQYKIIMLGTGNAMVTKCYNTCFVMSDGTDYLLEIHTEKIGLLDMDKIEELYGIGYETAKKHIHNIKKLVENKK